MADKGHYGGGQGTRQGIYVCSSSGDFLSSINSLNPDAVITTLKTALRKWQQLPERVRRRGNAANPMPAHRWETSYPDLGLVLVSVNRDLVSDQGDFRRSGDRWNRDHVWFSAEEARSWLPADPIPGQFTSFRICSCGAWRGSIWWTMSEAKHFLFPSKKCAVRRSRLRFWSVEASWCACGSAVRQWRRPKAPG